MLLGDYDPESLLCPVTNLLIIIIVTLPRAWVLLRSDNIRSTFLATDESTEEVLHSDYTTSASINIEIY